MDFQKIYMINNLRKAIYPLVKSICLYLNPFKNENTLYMMVTSAEGLKRIGTKVWDSITLEYLETLYKSMPKRMAAVFAAGGGHTKFWFMNFWCIPTFLVKKWTCLQSDRISIAKIVGKKIETDSIFWFMGKKSSFPIFAWGIWGCWMNSRPAWVLRWNW